VSARTRRGRWEGLAFVAPYLTIYFTLLICPLALGMWLSLQRADLFGEPSFIGFDNYLRLASDRVFLKSIGNTFSLVVLTVPALTAIALALALALNRPGRMAGLLRGLFFSSSVLSVTIVTLIWRFVLTPDGGLIATTLEPLGIAPIPFLNDSRFVLPAIALTSIWWCIGLPMMLFLAGLQQIPRDIYEAAALDGARRWKTFWSITLPALTRTLLIVILIESVLQFQLFGQAQVMTQGGPSGASRTIVLFIYDTSFGQWEVGYAAAAAQILFAIIILAALAQYRASAARGAKQ
jgi:multiple sugar transport system permease protein